MYAANRAGPWRWHLGRGLEQSSTHIAMDRALAEHRPVIHQSDQDIGYAATV